MEFQKVIEDRYSARAYEDKPVSEADVAAILEAGRIAPTAANRQNQYIFVCQGEEALKKAAECSPCTFGAPVVFIICYRQTAEELKKQLEGMSGVNFPLMDASITTTHMMLKAADLGLGSCWVGRFDKAVTEKVFDLKSRDLIPAAFLPVGYAAAGPGENHTKRKPLDETVEFVK